MRRIAAKLAIGLVITAIGMFAADTALGTWKLNPAKSTSTSSNKLVSRTDVREETPDGRVKVTRNEQWASGGPSHATYSYKYDGKEYPATGAQFDTVAVKRVNANTSSWEVKKSDGKYHQTGRIAISKDGKTMTQTFKGTDTDGKPVHGTNVYDKQ
jgi:glucose/arabinose dehydrogenase